MEMTSSQVVKMSVNDNNNSNNYINYENIHNIIKLPGCIAEHKQSPNNNYYYWEDWKSNYRAKQVRSNQMEAFDVGSEIAALGEYP